MNEDDDKVQNISMAIRRALEGVRRRPRSMGGPWPGGCKASSSGVRIEQLLAHVVRHCRAMAGPAGNWPSFSEYVALMAAARRHWRAFFTSGTVEPAPS